MNDSTGEALFASFRDPNGFLFTENGRIYRQINQLYREEYQKLLSSGLYQRLTETNKLIIHEECQHSGLTDTVHLVIQPEHVPFISYPYEWSFSQLKDAALLTLAIQMEALGAGMTLKDASAYNVQFLRGKPIFIDTLSFESYVEGSPWVAYKQFCQHFLAPLALMAYTDIRLSKLLINYIDGIPLDLASKLLPLRSCFSLAIGLHIHLHAKQQIKNSAQVLDKNKVTQAMPKKALIALLDNLQSAIRKLDWSPRGTEWHDYYSHNNNYEGESLNIKEQLVAQFIAQTAPASAWDLGANDGRFSRIAARYTPHVVSWDIDPACVENNYRMVKNNQEQAILPLLIDLANPSPAIGWANRERDSFTDRAPCDTLLALGLIHHLAISNNLPLSHIAKSFSGLCEFLIIEFVPKEDSQVVKLLSSREDIFIQYTQADFERVFSNYFSIEVKKPINGTVRTLYLLKIKH